MSNLTKPQPMGGKYRSSKVLNTKTGKFGRIKEEVLESDSDIDEMNSSASSDSMSPVLPSKRRKIKNVQSAPSVSSVHSKETERVTPDRISSNDNSELDSNSDSSGSESDDDNKGETVDGQWEIEKILNYVKDDYGEMYYVKWKDWDECFNTWEPPGNLLNCDDEMYRFYLEQKKKYNDALDASEYVDMPNGKRRRKGPALPGVPPDPRPFEVRVQEFFDANKCDWDNEEISKVCIQWKTKQKDCKNRWSTSKVNKYLQDGMDGRLSSEDIKALVKELILIEVEKRNVVLQQEIKEWEKHINAITGGRPYITIENDVDMFGPPIGFEFVNEYVPGDGVVIPKDPPVGCACSKESNCYDNRNKCCAMQFGYKFAYTKYRKVNVQQGSPIYECNSKCKCGPDCANRVVQDGKSDHKLSIFRTSNNCGWGVKTLKAIKKGSFVALYVGEVIKSEEADARGKVYDDIGCTYLFDLDFNDPDNYPYSVDASKYGNVTHFINHSCSPNLAVYAVWTDCLDPNLPKLAMFALRDIPKNEELTFDYNVQLNSDSRSKTTVDEEERPPNKRALCRCGTSKCRKYIFF